MTDHEAIQGLWRLVSEVSRGRPVGSCASHYLFSGTSQREIVPNFVDDGKLRSTFELDETAEPKKIVITLDYNGPHGPPDPNPIILQSFYRLLEDRLEIASGPGDAFPEEFGDEYGLMVLERDRGPMPESKKPSGTPDLVDDVLGRLEWDDNLNWYSRELLPSGLLHVCVSGGDPGSTDISLPRARQIVPSLDKYVELAKEYASDQLLGLKNDSWVEEGESPWAREAFMERMTLESVIIESDGGVTFYFHDGNLFWGHSIQIRMDAHDTFVDADIPG